MPLAEKKTPPSLHASKFHIDGHQYIRFSATLPVGVTIEDALQPEYWVHICHILQKEPVAGDRDKAGSIIEVRTEDHAFYAELYVRAVQERGLIVELVRDVVSFGPKEVLKEEGFETRWNIGKKGFDIIRKTDREIVADAATLPTKEMANEWIVKTVGA